MKRVVITGIGVISPLGSNVDVFWQNILAGETAVKPLTKLNKDLYKGNPLSAEVKDENNIVLENDENLSSYGKATEYACKAAKLSLLDAGLPSSFNEPNNYAVIIGTTSGNQDMVERTINSFDIKSEEDELSEEAAEMLSYFRPIELSSKVAELCNFGGTHMVIPTACAAGNYAFGTAYSIIKEGRTPIALAGGADPFTRSCYTIFYRLGAMTHTDCKPFDINRTGMIVGEGAAMLVLEDLDHALARGAKIYAELSNYALSCDAYHPTAPDPNASGAITAMKKVIENSNLLPEDISYISAHGTGTKANDAHEIIAMNKIFGENIENIPVHGLKSLIGHCMGAASAMEAVSAIMSIKEQVIPPTINTTSVDSTGSKGLFINNEPIYDKKVNHVLSNSFAFGGNVCSVIFSKYNNN